jgi:Rrf2 family transcriptional regulator, nitric oxide-sensitive transcriptional repressor
MRLQTATRIGLYATLELAGNPGSQITAAAIADKYGISINHLAKVMRDLGRAGLVESVRGAGGGFRFAGNPKRITLMDVIAVFENVGGDGRIASREPGETTPAGQALRQVLAEIDAITEATLRSITLDTMFKLIQRRQDAGSAARAGAAG